MSAASKVQRQDLPAWWRWWVSAWETGVSRASVRLPTTTERLATVVTEGHREPSWLRRGAPGLSAGGRKHRARGFSVKARLVAGRRNGGGS